MCHFPDSAMMSRRDATPFESFQYGISGQSDSESAPTRGNHYRDLGLESCLGPPRTPCTCNHHATLRKSIMCRCSSRNQAASMPNVAYGASSLMYYDW